MHEGEQSVSDRGVGEGLLEKVIFELGPEGPEEKAALRRAGRKQPGAEALRWSSLACQGLLRLGCRCREARSPGDVQAWTLGPILEILERFEQRS